jgi:hypothetical protein
MTQEGLEPRKKKNNREKMTLVRVEPMGVLTHNNKWASKSPNRKRIRHLGVEPTSLSLLSSKSTSESHHRKMETASQMRQATEKTGRVHSPMELGTRLTVVSLK